MAACQEGKDFGGLAALVRTSSCPTSSCWMDPMRDKQQFSKGAMRIYMGSINGYPKG